MNNNNIDIKDKRYYHNIFLETLEKVSKNNKKPTLLLHCCCGPCTCYPLSILHKYFNLTLLYVNPNIYPISEYERRYETLKRFALEYSKDNSFNLTLVKLNDDFNIYMNKFKSYSSYKEGSERCTLCHEYRLNLAYRYASEHNFDYFTTTMTVSSRKPSSLLNEIGLKLNKETYTNTKYLVSDFKKDNGTQIGIEISHQYNMYRQDYCGCNFSFFERNKRLNEKQD